MRIAIAGFQHETNTFAPMRATFEDFQKHDAWPGLTRGAAVQDALAGLNVPIAGFMQAARTAGQELVPSLWCNNNRYQTALPHCLVQLRSSPVSY